jgi:hypothetical protein
MTHLLAAIGGALFMIFLAHAVEQINIARAERRVWRTW